jgi:hypothetical protein
MSCDNMELSQVKDEPMCLDFEADEYMADIKQEPKYVSVTNYRGRSASF